MSNTVVQIGYGCHCSKTNLSECVESEGTVSTALRTCGLMYTPVGGRGFVVWVKEYGGAQAAGGAKEGAHPKSAPHSVV